MSYAPNCKCGRQPPHPYNVTVTFHRLMNGQPFFYPIVGAACEDWAEHAALNPGTLHIGDMQGRTLWPEGSKQ